MKTSTTGIKLIEEFEGCRLTAYQDSVGVWTIGYGHTKGVKRGQVITKEQAEHYLIQDVKTAENNVNKYNDRYKWTQNEFDALVSFAFNIGSINQLTANGTRTIEEISKKILAYNKAGGRELAGLTRRRKAEKALFDKRANNVTPKEEKVVNGANTASQTLPTVKKGANNTAVKLWQVILGVDTDGIFGSNTEKKTKELQKKYNLQQDGVVGEKTWKAGFDTVWKTI